MINHAGTKLLDYARDLDENSDIAIGGLDVLVNNIVGSGIGIEPQAKTRQGKSVPGFNFRLRDKWLEWARMPDVTRDYTIEELQQLSCRSWLRDGEVFAEFVQGDIRANRGRVVPLCVRAMESEWLPFMLNTPTSGRIVHGVEKDDDSIPVAYHFYKRLGDPSYQKYSTAFDTRRVLAETVLHLKFVRRLNQTRGVTIFHGVINRLDDIREIEDSERIAVRIASDFTAAIIRNPDMIDMPDNSNDAETGDVEGRYRNRYLEMGPGAVWDSLLPGEDVKGIGLDRPNTNLIEFLEDQHRRIASGIGCSNSSLTKKYDGNYSAQRQELVEQMPSYARMRGQFISDYVRPIYERFVFWAIESGAVSVPRNVDPATVSRADFRGPAQPWIDPLKESKAAETDVENGFKSRSMVIRERGYDPDLVNEQIELDMFVKPDDQPIADENEKAAENE
ncbi:MAG: phage portal protein [Desulfobulbaceae bacterium]|nr:phage portal protein [Desulfobulbaceae bacterium]